MKNFRPFFVPSAPVIDNMLKKNEPQYVIRSFFTTAPIFLRL